MSDIDIGQISEALNGKLDIGCMNANHTTTPVGLNTNNMPVVITTYVNGTSGYRIWADGYCEQWGEANTSTGDQRYRNVTYLKTFADNNYNLINDCIRARMTNDGSSWIFSKSATGCTLCGPDSGVNRLWRACGYLASGQY